MSKEIAQQLRIAADIEEGKAPYGWEYRRHESESWQMPKDRSQIPAAFCASGYQLRIRHKWQTEMDAFERGENIESRGKSEDYINGVLYRENWLPWQIDHSPKWETRHNYIEYRIAPKPALQFPTPPEGEELVTEHWGKQFTPEEFGVAEGWRPLLKSEYGGPNLDCQYWSEPIKEWAGIATSGRLSLFGHNIYRTKAPFPVKKLEFLTPGDGREICNPGNLTAEQVGSGYRVFLTEEYDGRHGNKAEFFYEGDWIISAGSTLNNDCTYRVSASTPWPPLKTKKRVPLTMEDWFTDGPWMLRGLGEWHPVVISESGIKSLPSGAFDSHTFLAENGYIRRNFQGKEDPCYKEVEA